MIAYHNIQHLNIIDMIIDPPNLFVGGSFFVVFQFWRKPLAIEGNALQMQTPNSWESLTIGRNPLLMSK